MGEKKLFFQDKLDIINEDRDNQILEMKEEGLPNSQIAPRVGVCGDIVRSALKRIGV